MQTSVLFDHPVEAPGEHLGADSEADSEADSYMESWAAAEVEAAGAVLCQIRSRAGSIISMSCRMYGLFRTKEVIRINGGSTGRE